MFGVPILDQPNLHSRTVIGSNCFSGFGVVIQAGTVLGDNCVVGANSVVRGAFPEGAVLVGSPARCVKVYNREADLEDTMANVLITGGAGFIGSHLTSALIQKVIR